MKKLTAAIKAMADEPRLSILIVLALRGAVCVSHLQEAMKTPQPTVSRYLAILRNAGLLEAERKGQWVYYRLNEEEEGAALEIVRKYAGQLKDTSKIKKIMDRLDKIEQQPSLTSEIETTDRKAKTRPGRVKKLVRKSDTVSEADPGISGELAKIVENQLPVHVGDLQIAEPAESHILASKQEVEVTAEIEKEAIETIEVEAEVKATPSEHSSVEKKRAKKEKKPQPPSLFDF